MQIIHGGDVHANGVSSYTSLSPAASAASRETRCGLCPQRATGLCSRVPLAETFELARAVDRVETVRKRASVAEQGGLAECLYRVVNGWVLLSHDSSSGDRTVLDVVVPGETFGLPGEADGQLYYTATALTSVTVCLIAHERLEQLRHRWPGLEERMLHDAASRLARRQRQAVYTAHGSAKARVAAFLLDAYLRGTEPSSNTDHFTMPLRQLDIADATGITAPYANKVLKSLSSEGALTLRRGYLQIENHDRLRMIASTALD